MSPAAAAVECQSPFTIKPSSSSSFSSSSGQNLSNKPNFSPFTSADDHLQNQTHSTSPSSPSSVGNANDGGFDVGVGVGNGTGSRIRPARPKPRLVKMRKQVRKSRSVASQTASGFNPFRLKGEDSGPINYNASLSNNGVLENPDRLCNEANVSNNKFAFMNEKVEFVFGANKSDVDRVSEGKPDKLDDMGFVCGGDRCVNLSSEKGDSSENMKNCASENVNYVFGLNFGWSSNSEKSECSRNMSDSGVDFAFGASCCNSESNVNSQESNLGENNGKPVSHDQGKMNVRSETEFQEVKAAKVRFGGSESLSSSEDYGKGVFVFGADNKKNLDSDDCVSLKCPNAKNLNGQNFGNESGMGQNENDNVDFNVNYKSKFVAESSSIIAGAPPTDPIFKLPDEMKKLHINESENDGGADKNYNSNKNPCVRDDTKFVPSSGLKPSFSSSRSSDPTHEQISGPGVAVETKVEDKSGAGYNDHIVFGKSCNIDSASSVNDYVSEAPSVVGARKKDESSAQGLGVSFTEFITPNWDPTDFKANLYSELNKKLELSARTGSIKDKRSKITRGKLKQPSFLKKRLKQVDLAKQSDLQENPNSPECYSPMDFSPYVETTAGDQPSRETSNESFQPDNNCAPSTSQHYVFRGLKDKKLVNAERFDINKNYRDPNEEISGHCHESFGDGYPSKGFVFGSETTCSSFNQEHVCCCTGSAGASAEHVDPFNTKIPDSLECFASGGEDQKHFTFSASSTTEGGLNSRRCLLRKKNKKKVGTNSFIISPSSNVEVSSNGEVGTIFEAAEQLKQGFISSNAAFQEACEMWRHRGNQAYKNGCLSKAEEFYTQGINSVPLGETAGCCIKPLVLCYSNRAATRISLGRMREALEDCVMAANIDPNFLKVYIRAANCHLVLGEIENALQYYNKILESGPEVCLDRRITIEAADGLQKAQKVAECTNRSAKLLEKKTSEATSSALEIIAEALSISSCSEKLLEMKAEALYMLRKYQELIQLCEQTLSVAENNFTSVGTDNCSVNTSASGSVEFLLPRLWRWRMISKSYFCMGKLEATLDLLQKLEQIGSIKNMYKSQILESSTSLAATIRELLHHKNAGNEAFRSGKYSEAVEHYTTALSSNIESRPFAAICFCNRAAAFQALGQIADAIADCSLAMALDGNYTKAVSRRAALHEMIRDYAQAASDLQRLVSILENQSNEKAKQSGSPSRSTGSKEIRQARRHMSVMEEEAKKGVRLDFYLILGVKAADTASDVKKAYRKAALRHHPDKAAWFVVRTENGDEGRLWKEIVHEVHKDADRLFKMIGEAYAVLSEPTKRSEYDLEEEIRKAPKESHRSNHYGRPSDVYSYSSRRSASKQYWQENWKTYSSSNSRW